MSTETISSSPLPSSRTSSASSSMSRLSRPSHTRIRGHRTKRRTHKFSAQNFIHARQFGEDVEQFYEIQDKIGAGGFGEVFRAIHKKTGGERAVKIIYKAEDDDDDFEKVNTTIRNEFAVIKSLDHVSQSLFTLCALFLLLVGKNCDGEKHREMTLICRKARGQGTNPRFF